MPAQAGPPELASAHEQKTAVLARAAQQLAEYFAGERRAFDLPLAPRGTPFQQDAWRALVAIPYGETRSYGEQARALGRPWASRAVGGANARNPLSIIVPCHRVIATARRGGRGIEKRGELTGYAGGLATKQWLLEHEARGAVSREPPPRGRAVAVR